MKKVMFVIMAAVVLASCNSNGSENVPTTDSVKVDTVTVELIDTDSIQVADSSVMVLDSTVSKIGKE